MSSSDSTSKNNREEQTAGKDRLGSWKEIARYMRRTVRTVQRWEKTSDLPIRRVQHQSGSSVFAFKHELDQWLRQQGSSGAEASQSLPGAGTPTTERPQQEISSPASRSETPGTWQRNSLSVLLILLVASVAYFFTQRDEAVERFDAIVPVLLTTSPGIERFPALSPDGKQVVYSWDGRDGQVDLYLKLVNADGQVRITDDEWVEEGPSWSPDGLSIAFVRRSGPGQRELRIVSPLGGPDRLVTRFEVPLTMDTARSLSVSTDWSPDGQWVALTTAGSRPETLGIVLWNVRTGEHARLTDPPTDVIDIHPRFSPDGDQLAFSRSPSALKGDLMVIDLDWSDLESSTQRKVPGATPWNTEPEWTVDGQELLFSSGRWPRTGLWRTPIDGSEPPRPLTGAGQGGSYPSMVELPAKSGSSQWRIVYAVNALENDIWEIDLDGMTAASPLLSSSQRERFPSYGTDGRIAFLSDRSGHREIWVADETGEEWQQWTDWQSAYIWRPSFSPDGRHLAYSVEIDGVLSAHIQGGPQEPPKRLIPDKAQDNDLAWSRDGSRVYISSFDRDPDGPSIWMVEPGSGNYRQVYSGAGYPLGEDTNGEWLLIASSDQAGMQLARFHLNSGEYQELELGDGHRHSMTLGPGGVYFVEQSGDGTSAIRWWSFASERVDTLLDLEHEPEVGLAISPDGQRALLARIMLQRSDLMMAEG